MHSRIMRPVLAVILGGLIIGPPIGWPQGALGATRSVAQQPAPPPAPPAPTPPAPAPSPSPPAPEQRRVTAIEIRGTRRIPAERVLSAVTATKVGEPVSEDQLRQDIRAIVDLGVFTDVTVRLEQEDSGVRVAFIVIENPAIAEVVVEGATAIAPEEVRQTFGLPTGEVLDLTRMREGARAVEKLYEGRGYVLARVTDLAVVPLDGGDNTARVRLRMAEGQIEAVQFSGLRKTRETTARRFIRETAPGKPFNVNQLNRDLQRLFDTGLFETINAQPRPGETPEAAVIVIEVKEARTTQIGGGVGYNSVAGALGFIEYSDRNWRGLAQTMSVRAERGLQADAPRFNYELKFVEPFFDDSGTSVELNMYSRASIEREYDRVTFAESSRFEIVRTGASASVSHPLDPLTTASLRLKTELTDITPLPFDSTGPVPPSLLSPGKVVSLALTGLRDARDDRLLPRRGDRTTLSVELATPVLGSTFAFTKYILDYQRVFPVGRASAITSRLFVGGSSGDLPLQEYFIFGGPSTVRALQAGFARDTSILVANLEYRFPLGTLVRQLGELQGIVFVDAGRAPFSGGSLHSGYGVGVAMKTPVGPLRIDFAFGPQGRQTWLSVGSPF